MFRSIRTKQNELPEAGAKALLRSARRGVLAVLGDGGYPYAVPLNYRYDEDEGRNYFNGARAGHKAEAIRACGKVCFTVYGNERIPEDEPWAPFVQSAVAFGQCRPVEDGAENLRQLKAFAMKYYPSEGLADREIASSGAAAQMYVIEIRHLSGKEVQEK